MKKKTPQYKKSLTSAPAKKPAPKRTPKQTPNSNPKLGETKRGEFPPGELRLQVYLARSGVCSRRAAEELISSGRVSVNGKRVTEMGTKVLPTRDEVRVKDVLVRPEQPILFLFNKPQGVITTLRDTHGRPCLQEYLEGVSERLFPVGRLDADVSGLLVLTNDGEFAESLLHPRYGVERVYQARVSGIVDSVAIQELRRGVVLEDGGRVRCEARNLPANTETAAHIGACRTGESYIELTLREGAKHVVKKLLEEVGHPVVRLTRVRFGSFSIGDLRRGELRQVPFPVTKRVMPQRQLTPRR